MVELLVGLSLLLIGSLSFFPVVRSSISARETTANADQARLAMESAADSLRRYEFSAIYRDFHGSSVPVDGLESPLGGPANVAIQCFVNELSVPNEFGPVIDLDGSGGLTNPDCVTTYRLLPVRLSLTWASRDGTTTTREMFLIVERGTSS